MRAILFSLGSILLTVSLAAQTAQAETVRVTSYNTGLLQHAVDFVPCVSERTGPQSQAIFSSDTIMPKGENFLVFLQEVWTSAGYSSYKALAESRGLFLFPSTYSQVKNNGEIIITNMPIVNWGFLPFGGDDHAQRGIRFVTVKFGTRLLVAANVHTSYSDSSGFLPAHKLQIQETAQFADAIFPGADLIIGGDFNAGARMAFRKATYDPNKTIWRDWIMPQMTAKGLRPIGDQNSVTWDEENNPLVYNPTRVIRYVDEFEYGDQHWDQTTSRMDQIFVSSRIKPLVTGRTMMQRVKLASSCVNHSDAQGFMRLSDHYGIFADLELQ